MYVRLSTNPGMSLQRVEGVNKGIVGCAHRRRWQSGKHCRGEDRGACVVNGRNLGGGLCPLMLFGLVPTGFWTCGRLRLSDKYQHIRRRQKTIRISLRKDSIADNTILGTSCPEGLPTNLAISSTPTDPPHMISPSNLRLIFKNFLKESLIVLNTKCRGKIN